MGLAKGGIREDASLIPTGVGGVGGGAEGRGGVHWGRRLPRLPALWRPRHRSFLDWSKTILRQEPFHEEYHFPREDQV